MEKPNHHQDEPLHRFDQWLKECPVQPQDDLLERIRLELGRLPTDVDAMIDELLLPDHNLREPDMVSKVRRHLDDAPRGIDWFKWLTPLAAAAVLTLAFISFQTKAPESPAATDRPAGLTSIEPTPSQLDEDITEIFALATNLQGNADMTQLESVENLALLF